MMLALMNDGLTHGCRVSISVDCHRTVRLYAAGKTGRAYRLDIAIVHEDDKLT
jgi:hypothetical protein